MNKHKMMMETMANTIDNIKEQFNEKGLAADNGWLAGIQRDAFFAFNEMGVPAARHEEWKYTRIGSLFNKEYRIGSAVSGLTPSDLDAFRIPGHKLANEIVFVNGRYMGSLSALRSTELVVMTLGEAADSEYREIVSRHLGHSSDYANDGINALNTAFADTGVFIHAGRNKAIPEPVYIYHITDTRMAGIFSQPRSLVYLAANAQLKIVETYTTLGSDESFTNQVNEMVLEEGAILDHLKIQDDIAQASQVSTTHIRQLGKSLANTMAVSLNGTIVRNNTNIVMEAEHCEAHLLGLYLIGGNTHVDNHTVVDNRKPNCYSNELYKGIMDDSSTGVFNGKIFVRQDAQKTNAYQSNRNILLSPNATVNTKPQLEIFADDVKCSHGCTIGRLDEEGLFYLRSRGIPASTARSLLLHGFAEEIINKIKIDPVRVYVDRLITKRLALH